MLLTWQSSLDPPYGNWRWAGCSAQSVAMGALPLGTDGVPNRRGSSPKISPHAVSTCAHKRRLPKELTVLRKNTLLEEGVTQLLSCILRVLW